jgi:branched-chain amino acid transport system ATP-binding protein
MCALLTSVKAWTRMLSVEGLSCGYGAIRAASDVSFTVPKASIFALLGPNGAGKTSTIMAIMGHVDVHAGRILLDGNDLARRRAVERARLGVAVVPEGRQIFGDLSVDENLTIGGYSFPQARDQEKRERVFELFPRLRERRSQVAGSMSGGEQQMLAISRALMAEPRLLLVDELSLGLMPKMVDICMDALLKLRDAGMAIVLVEQNTSRALAIADNVCVLSSGSVAFQGSGREAREDRDLLTRFLGMTERRQA